MSLINLRLAKRTWLIIALSNLLIVAVLGLLLRSKILFSIPMLDFKYMLHTHSHYAFGGWVSLALMVLMTYEILPKRIYNKPIYQVLFGCTLINAIGMLISFAAGGYNMVSILFSTLFIFTSYVFAWVFTKDVLKGRISKTVRHLSISSVVYLVLSSTGPFTLGYLLASGSGNAYLYKDAIYTYLHLQYNGFFTLAIFALLFNRLEHTFSPWIERHARLLALFLNIAVLPSLFLAYLWHYPNIVSRIIAAAGSISILISLIAMLIFAVSAKKVFRHLTPATKLTLAIAGVAFILKSVFQPLTIIPGIGEHVFNNRPVIIAFLHLVLLGFVTIYILTHYSMAGILRPCKSTNRALAVFTGAVIFNETILFLQGADIMLMHNSNLYPQLLWCAAILLLTGAVMLLAVAIKTAIPANGNTPIKTNLSHFQTSK